MLIILTQKYSGIYTHSSTGANLIVIIFLHRVFYNTDKFCVNAHACNWHDGFIRYNSIVKGFQNRNLNDIFIFFFTNKGLIMYEFLTLLQFVIIIVFGISVFVIYQHGFIQSKVLNSGACNELAIAILVFAVLQLLISYLLKKFSKK